MKKEIINQSAVRLSIAIVFLLQVSCKRDFDSLLPATYPVISEVFIDGFSPSLNYAAFSGSVPSAFRVDSSVTYNSSATSMRFEVPDQNDPKGAYAGGVFFTSTARDLSGFDALTFWAKASQPVNVGIFGFGNDLGTSTYQVAIQDVPVNSNWKKIIIPIPDRSKLKAEKGMFYYSAGPENNRGYTLWVDDVRFEKLGTLGHATASMLNGADKEQPSYVGVNTRIDDLSLTFNLPSGVNQSMAVSPYYYTFTSSNPAVATVSPTGIVSTVGGGTTKITAMLDTIQVKGSLTINSAGNYIPAPTPTQDAANVISVFSDKYTNVPVDYYNGYWQPFQTTLSADFSVNGDNVLNYTNFNFVGTQISSPTIDVSSKAFLHLDVFIPGNLNSGAVFSVRLVDFGANGAPGGGDDATDIISYTAPTLKANSWISLDIPFSSLPNLTTKRHIGQIIYEGSNLPNFFADNVYFWSNPSTPIVAAPNPTKPAANVISIFSDAYTNVAGTDLNPNWGQATVVSQVSIAGNNTLKYAGLNYQGTQFGSNQNVSGYGFLHLDYYSSNSSNLNIYLISPGPVEKSYTLSVPTGGATGWVSVDIPLSAFAPVDLTNVFQIKFDGNGDIFLDNMYFWTYPSTPATAAPAPTHPAADVISIFSDAYTNVVGTDLNPNWGQNTVVTQEPIAGNNTLKYASFNYQGIQFGSNQDVSALGFLHLDYYSANATSVKVYIISPGPVETAYVLNVPTNGAWTSIDIPLSAFAPVDLTNVFQIKFDSGNGSSDVVFLDNIYFRK